MSTTVGNIIKTGDTRVFLIEGRAGPVNSPAYMAAMAAGASARSYGDVTQVQIPSPDAWDTFEDVDQIRGEKGRATIPLTGRYLPTISDILKIAESGCPLDIQIPIGKCKDPRNLNLGWDTKKLIFEDVVITNYATSELGTMESSGRAAVDEEIDASARSRYEIKRLGYKATAGTQITQEVIDIRVCDSPACGQCGLESDGCQVVFALTLSVGGSPGSPAEILFTENGGLTWDDTLVSTLTSLQDPNELACVGQNLVVVSEDSEALHYAPIADILNSVETWVKVTTGFVALKGPLAIWSAAPDKTWITGEGGYIYFTEDPTTGVTVQEAGTGTTQDLNDVDGCDALNLVAVGASNAVLVTSNGGDTWTAITGPAVGVILNTVEVKSPYEWWIGAANGNMYYTVNAGLDWATKAFSGSAAGTVRHIEFATDSIGFMAHSTAASVGRIFRTDDGGNSWYRDSDATNIGLPDNDRINRVAVCHRANPMVRANVVFAAGLGANAIDGIILKGA